MRTCLPAKAVYQIVSDQIVADAEKDPSPVTMARFATYEALLRNTLQTRSLDPSTARPKPRSGKQATTSSEDDFAARLRALEDKPHEAQRYDRGRGRGRRGRGRGRGKPDDRGRSPSPPPRSPERVCFTCGSLDHLAGSCQNMHPAAKRHQERLRKLSEEAGAADEFSDSEVGEDILLLE